MNIDQIEDRKLTEEANRYSNELPSLDIEKSTASYLSWRISYGADNPF